MRAGTLRVLNDENCPPEAPVTKTIHQRNKSSPALTTLNLGQIKKRTAFGDVSNISNVPVPKRVSKDDSSVDTKPASNGLLKGGQLQERKSTNFLRPPQRPLSVSLKNLLSGSSNDAVSKIPLNDSTSTQQTAPTRKTLTKRNTTIFKDTSLNVVPENEVVIESVVNETAEKVEASTLPPLTDIDVTHLGSRLHFPPPTSTDKIDLKLPTLSELSLPGIDEVSLDPQLSGEIEVEVQAKDKQNSHITDVTDVVDDASNKTQYVDALPNLTQPTDPVAIQPTDPMGNYLISHGLQQFHEPIPEPEECWEEDYDDAYDGDGYVTARSFRSRGDDTTGGATTILEPKFNHKVRKEIAEAKIIVEAERTQDDIDDENFDTSMVAEYGDEIFSYMRHQEEKMLPRANYMDDQHEIQWSMRAVLMDWLVQVHHR